MSNSIFCPNCGMLKTNCVCGTYKAKRDRIKYTKGTRENPQNKYNRRYSKSGQYNSINTDNYRNRLPAYRIGTAQRRGLNNSASFPGPGQYGPDNSTSNIRPNTPAWKIGTGLRQELNSSDRTIPGVGNYNISNGLGDGPKYSMLGKGNTFSISNEPTNYKGQKT